MWPQLAQQHRDGALGDLAGAQHGGVGFAQLVALGVPSRTVARWTATGRLRRLYRGVYAVGHAPLTAEGRWMAATLALGDGALLSVTSAGSLWDLRATTSARIHVTVSGRGARARRAGITVHRVPTVAGTTHRGIPVTTPAQTLLDLAAALPMAATRAAVDRSVTLRLFDLAAIDAVALPGRPGTRALRQAIAEHDDAPTRSELERRFLRLCRDHGIPRPRVNAMVCGYEVDFSWPHARLVVETDGARHHATRMGMEADRRRDAALTLAGWRVQRFTWRQVTGEPATVATVMRTLLDR